MNRATPPPAPALESGRPRRRAAARRPPSGCGPRRPGLEAEREQVAAEQDRRRRAVLDAERARALEEPVHRRAVELARSRPRQSARARRASSSRSTFCASRRNAPSPTGDATCATCPASGGAPTRPTTWWRTSKPSIVCTFSRSSSASAGATPASSWSGERMRPSMNAVVAGLPKSWQTAPSMIVEPARAVEVVDARAAPRR